MTKFTLSDIRHYLSELAKVKGRPDYDICVAKTVRDAFENETDHPLKEEIKALVHFAWQKLKIGEFEPKKEFSRSKKYNLPPTEPNDIEALKKWIDASKGRVASLAKEIGCSAMTISQIKNGKRPCTKEFYEKLLVAKQRVIAIEMETPGVVGGGEA